MDLQKSKSCSTKLISPCDKMTVYADKESVVNAIYIDFWKAFDHLTQHSDLKAEEAFQSTSKNTELSDSQEIPLALRIKHRGMESTLYCLNNAFITLDMT